MKHLTITGTRRGMTDRQKTMLAHLLAVCRTRHGFSVFHDGECVGVDVEARAMAFDHGYTIISHPSTANTRSLECAGLANETRTPKPPLDRNRDMVNEADLVVGCPGEDHEILRSGTWACLRYTGKMKKRTIIVWPDGRLGIYEGGYNGIA